MLSLVAGCEMLCGAVPGRLSPRLPSSQLQFAALQNIPLRPIAVHPEPAGRPAHGLLSRRSTDRNVVLFRWIHNVLKVHHCKVPKVHILGKISSQSFKLMNLKGKYFFIRSGEGQLTGV